MNQKLKQIDISNVLFWDLETVREHENLEPNSEAYHLFEAKHRDKVTGDVLEQSELLALYNKVAALSPTHTKIVCASMGFVSGGKIHIKSITGSQGFIVSEFLKVLSKNKIPCGYNIIQYDFPILRQKAFQEGLIDMLPERYNDSNKKEWNFIEYNRETNIVDLMFYLKGTYYYSQSLAEACYLAGIPSPKNGGIDGSQVSDFYYAGKLDEIKHYCERDIVSVVQLFQRMRGEDITTEVDYKETINGVDSVMNTSSALFETIHSSGKIPKDAEKKILDASKTFDADEKRILVDIIKACLNKEDADLTKEETLLISKIYGTKS